MRATRTSSWNCATDLDFERKIFVKKHSAWLLRQELKQVRAGQSIAIGTATDPYQPAERKFGITRAIMEEFSRHEGLFAGIGDKVGPHPA